jgi:hypothetical protein
VVKVAEEEVGEELLGDVKLTTGSRGVGEQSEKATTGKVLM